MMHLWLWCSLGYTILVVVLVRNAMVDVGMSMRYATAINFMIVFTSDWR